MRLKTEMKKALKGARRQIEKIAAGLLALALIWTAFPAEALAASTDTLEVYVESADGREDGLKIYVNTNVRRSEAELTAEDFSVTLGNTELPCTDVQYFSDTSEPVSYVFLVDVSGSISSGKLERMKEYLRLVAAGLDASDRVCLITLGNELSVGEFTSGRENVNAQIESIEGLYDDTNLYYGIVEALELLASDTQEQGKKALLVLSDGEDEQATGITREEVDKALEKYTIPVFTVAMLEEGSDTRQQEFAKILGSFARLSAGGVHTALGIDDISVEDSAARMAAIIDESLVLTADTSGYEGGSGQVYLQVEANAEGYGQAADSVPVLEKNVIYTGDASASGGEASESGAQEDSAGADSSGDGSGESGDAAGESGSPSGESSDAVGESSGASNGSDASGESGSAFPLWIVIAAAVVVVLIIVIIVAVSLGRRKKRRLAEQQRLEEERRQEELRQEEERRQAQLRQEQEAAMADGPGAQEKTSFGEGGLDGEMFPQTGELGDEDSEQASPDDEPEDTASTEGLPPDGQTSAATVGRPLGEAGPGDMVVYLTRIGVSEARTYQIILRGETTIGRDPQKSAFAFPEDLHMSGLHCSLTYFDNRFILCDKGSMNGTKVNGVPITGPYPLNRDDIIQIGNSEFRIHW